LCGETIFLVIGMIPKPLCVWFLFEFVLNIGLGCFVFCALCLFVSLCVSEKGEDAKVG
jgi:hypothetical protein